MSSSRPLVTTRLPVSQCPTCETQLDAASHLAAVPKPGDFSICIQCGALLQFRPDLIVRLASPKALEELRTTQPQDWAAICRVQKKIRSRFV